LPQASLATCLLVAAGVELYAAAAYLLAGRPDRTEAAGTGTTPPEQAGTCPGARTTLVRDNDL